MNKFEKVSFDEFKKAMDQLGGYWDDDDIKHIYDHIKIPQRSTKKAAGYDFFTPITFVLEPTQAVVIPTGIKCFLDDDKVLQIYPRSGLGFKKYAGLANTVGIIDADYVESDNEGHIMIKIRNNGYEVLDVSAGKAFAQGIITQYFTVVDDDETEKQLRNGGFGSTNV